jgi:hypothetical protein
MKPYIKSMKTINSKDWLIAYFKMLNGKLNLLHNFKRAVSRKPLIAEGQFLSQEIPYGILVEEVALGQAFLRML